MNERYSQSSDLSYLGINVSPLPNSIISIIRPDLTKTPRSNQYVWASLKEQLKSHILSLNSALTETGVQIIEPPSKIHADLTVVCHEMARILRKNPVQIAQELTSGFNQNPNPEAIKQADAQNGYLNFQLSPDTFTSQVITEIETYRNRYGEQNIGAGKTTVIDCSSPNVAKYMSVGHLRSTIIGESLTRIHKARGYTVIRDNHLGDWGTQFGMLIRAHELWSQDYEELHDNTNPVQGLYKLYVRIHDEVEKEKAAERQRLGDPEAEMETQLEKEGKKWFQRLENGDEEALKLLRWATKQSLSEFQKVYDLLGSSYEYMLGESFYISMLPAVLQYMRERGIATLDETGAMIVDLSERKLGRLVVQKSDGTSLYATRDLATLVARCAWFQPASILYVVGEDQQEYFQQVFATFDKMTDTKRPHLEHIHFGMIKLPEGKMSTRAGRVIFLTDVLDEAIERARQKISEINKNLSPEEKETIARQVGVGAVVFFDLGQNRERSISFDWDKALSFTGYSAPYIQYAHARMSALLRRAQEEKVELRTDLPIQVIDPSEFLLIKQLSKFPEAVALAGARNSPDIIADHVYRTANLFNDVYKKVSVFNEPDVGIKNTRLRLTQAAARVVKKGLNLLCIEAPERM